MENAYYINNYPTMRASFGVEATPPTVPPTYTPTDPVTLTATTIDPTGVQIPYLFPATGLVKESVANYALRFKLTRVGPWIVRWNATFPDGTSSETDQPVYCLVN